MEQDKDALLEVMTTLVSALAVTAQVSKDSATGAAVSTSLADRMISPAEVQAWKAATAAMAWARTGPAAHQTQCDGFMPLARR